MCKSYMMKSEPNDDKNCMVKVQRKIEQLEPDYITLVYINIYCKPVSTEADNAAAYSPV